MICCLRDARGEYKITVDCCAWPTAVCYVNFSKQTWCRDRLPMNLFIFLYSIRLSSLVRSLPLFKVPPSSGRVSLNKESVWNTGQGLRVLSSGCAEKKMNECKIRKWIGVSHCDDCRFIGCWTIPYYWRKDVSCCFAEMPAWWECQKLVEELPPFPFVFWSALRISLQFYFEAVCHAFLGSPFILLTVVHSQAHYSCNTSSLSHLIYAWLEAVWFTISSCTLVKL